MHRLILVNLSSGIVPSRATYLSCIQSWNAYIDGPLIPVSALVSIQAEAQ